MLAKFERLLRRALENKMGQEEVAKEADKIEPSFGNLIRKASPAYWLTILFMILQAICSCTGKTTKLDIKLDVNRVIDQLMNKPPGAILKTDETTQPAKPAEAQGKPGTTYQTPRGPETRKDGFNPTHENPNKGP